MEAQNAHGNPRAVEFLLGMQSLEGQRKFILEKPDMHTQTHTHTHAHTCTHTHMHTHTHTHLHTRLRARTRKHTHELARKYVLSKAKGGTEQSGKKMQKKQGQSSDENQNG